MNCPHCNKRITVPDFWEFFNCENCSASLEIIDGKVKLLKTPQAIHFPSSNQLNEGNEWTSDEEKKQGREKKQSSEIDPIQNSEKNYEKSKSNKAEHSAEKNNDSLSVKNETFEQGSENAQKEVLNMEEQIKNQSLKNKLTPNKKEKTKQGSTKEQSCEIDPIQNSEEGFEKSNLDEAEYSTKENNDNLSVKNETFEQSSENAMEQNDKVAQSDKDELAEGEEEGNPSQLSVQESSLEHLIKDQDQAESQEDFSKGFENKPLHSPVEKTNDLDKPKTHSEDLSSIAEFGNAPPHQNFFYYQLKISGICSEKLLSQVEEILQQKRLKLNAPELIAQIQNDSLTIDGLHAVKTMYLVKQLSALPLDVTWLQKSRLN